MGRVLKSRADSNTHGCSQAGLKLQGGTDAKDACRSPSEMTRPQSAMLHDLATDCWCRFNIDPLCRL